MTEAKSSYRGILRSSFLIGGASIFNIGFGILRSKILALLVGPAGVGVTSLYTSLITTAATFATMGVGTFGTRQIAEASSRSDWRKLAVARRAIVWGTLILSLSAGCIL